MTARPLRLNPDRLFPADPSTRTIARALPAAIAAEEAHCSLVRRGYRIGQPISAALAA